MLRLVGKFTVVRIFVLGMLLVACAAEGKAQQLFQVTTPQGDVLVSRHVAGAAYSLFDLYDPKTGACVVTVDMAYTDPTTHVQGKLSNPNIDYLDEIGRIKAALGKNTTSMYSGPAVPFGAPCSSGGAPAAASPAGATASANGDLPPCPVGSLANYWNGTSWMPMRTPELLNSKAGFSAMDAIKNPFYSRAGDTGIARFRGASSPITVDPSPKFCFFISQNMSQDFLVGFVDVKGDHREIEFHQMDRGPEKWIPQKRQEASTTKFVGNAAIVTLNAPLPAGQYIVGSSGFNMFDFGVN